MRIWFLADTHFGYKNDDDVWLNDYYDYFNNVYIPLVKKNYKKGDILVHLGDVFDNRSRVGIDTITRVVDIFEQLGEVFGDVRIVVGNHDIFNKSTNDVTALRAIGHIPNVKVYYNPTIEVISGKRVMFLPWFEESEIASGFLNKNDFDYVFTHADIYGAHLVKGSVNTNVKSIKPSDFKDAQVYAGHIHIRQDMYNIHYVGTPYEKDRGDIDNIKGVTILDVDTGKTAFVENKYSPRYLKENIYDILDLTVGDLKTRWKNNYIDLHILGNYANVIKTEELSKHLVGLIKEIKTCWDSKVETVVLEESNISEMKTFDEYNIEWMNKMDCTEKDQEILNDMIKMYKDRL